MSSLLASLPAPKQQRGTAGGDGEQEERPSVPGRSHQQGDDKKKVELNAPGYGHRKGFIPRRLSDFDQGGAYPEIHVAQYPLEMGKPGKQRSMGAAHNHSKGMLALSVTAEGDVAYDALLRRDGNGSKQLMHTGHAALVPKLEKLNGAFERPDAEEEDEVAKETAAVLAAKVSSKQAAVNPKNVPKVPGEAQFIKYTPAGGNTSHAAANARIIQMQDMPVDPLEPPKFPHVKVPRGSGSPPVPVMHSPPRALTAQDHKDWKIPPCVSNWKNAKGYTIPLDKRLAADGRGLQEVQINDGFAKFSEALYIAENKARTAVETRAKMQREMVSREKERKEAELRDLAMQARMDRMRGVQGRDEGVAVEDPGSSPSGSPPRMTKMERDHARRSPSPVGRRQRDAYDEEDDARRRRDDIRDERRRERERERRLEAKQAHGYKRSKLTRDKDRDISEKIALGMAKVSGGEAMYDQRLFNQDTGTQAGIGAEDAYNLYDKPLFTDRSDVYRAKGNGSGEDVDTSRFKPSKGFAGTDYSKEAAGGPVEFEAEDPFGLDAFLTDVRKGKDALDSIGSRGQMIGSAGDGSGSGSRTRMQFTKGSSQQQ